MSPVTVTPCAGQGGAAAASWTQRRKVTCKVMEIATVSRLERRNLLLLWFPPLQAPKSCTLTAEIATREMVARASLDQRWRACTPGMTPITSTSSSISVRPCITTSLTWWTEIMEPVSWPSGGQQPPVAAATSSRSDDRGYWAWGWPEFVLSPPHGNPQGWDNQMERISFGWGEFFGSRDRPCHHLVVRQSSLAYLHTDNSSLWQPLSIFRHCSRGSHDVEALCAEKN